MLGSEKMFNTPFGEKTLGKTEEECLWNTSQQQAYLSIGYMQEDSFPDPFGASQLEGQGLKVHSNSKECEDQKKPKSLHKPDKSLSKNPRKPGRKPKFTGLTCRKDVAFKNLLRKIRRLHWEKLKMHTKFTTKKKQTQVKCRTFLKEYIEKELGMEPNEDFLSILNLYLFSEKPRLEEPKNIFRELLYRYNSSGLHKCLQNKYFRCLVYHYIFEAGPQISDSNLKIAMNMMESKCKSYECQYSR